MLAKIENDKIVKIPYNLKEDYPNKLFPANPTKEQLPSNVVQVNNVVKPTVDYADVIDGGYVYDPSNKIVNRVWITNLWPDDKVRLYIKTLITNKRYTVETSGINVNGKNVDTSLEAQNRISNQAADAQRSSTPTINFKYKDGTWSALTLQQFLTLADTVASFREACFNAEMVHYNNINAITSPTTEGKSVSDQLKAYDYSSGWPSSTIS